MRGFCKKCISQNSFARLIVESKTGPNLVFNGNIQNGKCNIPIKRLKGLLDENSCGNMFLEIIVEDTYFKPWETDFVVEEHTSVKVKVTEQSQSSKPIIEVNALPSGNILLNENKKINFWVPLYELGKICERFNITKSNISTKKSDFYQIVQEYFKINPEFKSHKSVILSGIRDFLR